MILRKHYIILLLLGFMGNKGFLHGYENSQKDVHEKGNYYVWHIQDIRSESNSESYKVACTIYGKELWFESNVPLAESVEAFASILILPALAKNAIIMVDGPIDKTFYDNVEKLAEVYNEWWGYPKRNPLRVKAFKDNPTLLYKTTFVFAGETPHLGIAHNVKSAFAL